MQIIKETFQFKGNINELISVAKKSTCKRSKCGSVIVTNPISGFVIGRGYNSMPCDITGDCFKDKLAPTFKSDRTCCVHAEQRAILNAYQTGFGSSLPGSTLIFIRLDENGKPKHSGAPYCSICSKMVLDVGIAYFVLWHKEGWTAYDAFEYNELTFKYK